MIERRLTRRLNCGSANWIFKIKYRATGSLITKEWCWIKNPGKTWRKTVLNMVSAKGLWGAEGDLPSNGLQGKVI